MTKNLNEFRSFGARVLVLSFDDIDAVAYYHKVLDLPFSVASDPDRSAYRSYGLERGSKLQVWHPRTLWLYAKLMFKGMKLRRPTGDEDLEQLGGDFVIGVDQRLTFVHRSLRPDDRPPVSALLEALRAGADPP